MDYNATMLLFVAALLKPVLALHLIPTPQNVNLVQGTFKLGTHVPIIVAKKSDDEDSYAAEGLIDESPTSFGWGSQKKGKPFVIVGRIGRDRAVDAELKSLKLELPKNSSPEAYILCIRPKKIICAGNSATGTYYAVQTLKQILRSNKVAEEIPCTDIIDWPALEIRGWQDDISRGPIPTLEFLKKQVRELSEYKLNALTLYTEHVFRLEKYPSIAPKEGITAEEVVELDKYCKKHHVQLIGNFQSFGHFANILKNQEFANIRETSDVITPAREESYEFLKNVYHEIAPAYSSKFFNINCDETYGLGEGPAKEMVAKQGLGNVYAGHINRIAKLLKSEGKTPMMWGDIALQYPDIRKNLPKDLIVLTWGYDPRQSFVDQIEPFTKIGFKFLVCPGVSCWGQNFPDFQSATVNISNFVRDGYTHGAMGMMNTSWDDTGENLFNNNWFPLIWGAEVSWKPALNSGEQNVDMLDRERNARLATFDNAFPRLFYGLPDGRLTKALWNLSNLRMNPITFGQSDREFWKLPWQIDPMLVTKSKGVSQQVMDIQLSIHHAMSRATRNAETLKSAEFACSKVAYLYSQLSLMSSLSVLEKVPDDAKAEAAEFLSSPLGSQMEKLREDYERAWKIENRNWWLDRNIARFREAERNSKAIGVVPMISPSSGVVTKQTEVTIWSLNPAGSIYFTLDGSEPTRSSTKYTGAFKIEESAMVRAINVLQTGVVSPVVSAQYTMLSRPAKLETAWNHYGGNTNEMAFDGMLDTYFWSYGQVAAGGTFAVIFDDPDMVGGIEVTTGHPDHPEDYLKEGVLEVSPDGQKWREVAKFEKGNAKTGMIGYRVKGIRIRVTKDNGNWLVIREIAIN